MEDQAIAASVLASAIQALASNGTDLIPEFPLGNVFAAPPGFSTGSSADGFIPGSTVSSSLSSSQRTAIALLCLVGLLVVVALALHWGRPSSSGTASSSYGPHVTSSVKNATSATTSASTTTNNTIYSLRQPLPPGWQQVYDHHSGQTYYWNAATNHSQWNRPLS